MEWEQGFIIYSLLYLAFLLGLIPGIIIRHKDVSSKNIYYLIKVNCLPCWWTIFYRKKIHAPINFTVGGQLLFSWHHHNHYFHSNFKDSCSSTSINQLIKMIFKFLHIRSARVLPGTLFQMNATSCYGGRSTGLEKHRS